MRGIGVASDCEANSTPCAAPALKVPALHALAPSVPPAGPVFAVVQGVVLVFFVLVIIGAWRRFRPMAAFA